MCIAETISRAIKEAKWLDITYLNQQNEITYYWIAIKDIIISQKKFIVDIFNDKKSLETLTAIQISFDNIKEAKIINFSTYEVPNNLLEKIESNLEQLAWLKYDLFNYNILNYYKECTYYDNDPSQTKYDCIKGIDLSVFRKQKTYDLNEEQIKKIVSDIYEYDISANRLKFNTLAMNVLSIDINKSKYVVCYYEIKFNPQTKQLSICDELIFNESFLIEGRPHSLQQYINMDVEVFINTFKENYREYRELIISNLSYGEMINERPEIMLLERIIPVDLSVTYSAIENDYLNNCLSIPLKAFFGNNRRSQKKNEPTIVIYDKKININQMRVLYSSMKYPVTYVQGPPGTGKTQTIVNVILSGFYNEKKMLICSSNNKPVDGIIEKLFFKYYDLVVPFPYIRLGNIEEIKKATIRINELAKFETDKVVKENLINNIQKENDKTINKLIRLLEIQERRIDLEDKIISANKLIESFKGKKSKVINLINDRVSSFEEELKKCPEITNEMVLDLFTPLSEDKKMLQYLYYKSLAFIQKLKLPRYKDLISICSITDDEKRVSDFNKWLAEEKNMKLLMDAFPVIFTTNISAKRLGTPNNKFDLVIMDEAGQCNVATALIPISRANNLLLVGDPNQLRPVIVMQDETNELLIKKYNVNREYDYKKNSILDVMSNRDKISKYILLKYHYRCGKSIINFSNMRYYNKTLNLDALKENGKLEVLDVKNKNIIDKNSAYDEAKEIVEYIKRNKLEKVSIITPFVNQNKLITSMLKKEGIEGVKCGTIHSIQGAENSTIIFSLAISLKSSQRTYDWIKNNHELINVAVTRAQNKLVIAGDMEAVNLKSDKKDDLYNLCEYVRNNGKIVIPQSETIKIEIGKSNGSKYEDEFYKTISQFCSTHKKYEVTRNTLMTNIFPDIEEIKNTKYEFDCVIYEKTGFGDKPYAVFEVNGGEHLGTIDREKSDALKQRICRQKEVKIIFIPNELVKAYEYIREVLCEAKDDSFQQLSLFDYFNE